MNEWCNMMQHASLKMILYFKHYAYEETCYEILT
jgi:hypothetical protein